MLPEPERDADNSSPVEITDLDSPPALRKPAERQGKLHRISPLRVRIWMSVALIAAIALLVVLLLASLLHPPQAAKVKVPPLPTNYPVSLTAASGICYLSSTTGVVTAIQASEGRILWQRAVGKAGEGSITVVDGVIYLAPRYPPDSHASTVPIEALRARDGSLLWTRTLPTDSPFTFQFSVVNNAVYVASATEKIDALRASDGSLLWSYTTHVPIVSLPAIADGMVYVATVDGHLSALSAGNGIPRWTYRSPQPIEPSSPIIANGMLYLSLQGGILNAIRTSTGTLLWHYASPVLAQAVLPLLLFDNGFIYALTQDGHLLALLASNGSISWIVSLHTADILPFLTVSTGVIYVETQDGSLNALSENSGSLLWYYQNQNEGGIPALFRIAQGEIFLSNFATTGSGVNPIGSITVLQASDGSVLWRYTPHVSVMQVLPIEDADLVLISLQDGSIEGLRASTGSLLWHHLM